MIFERGLSVFVSFQLDIGESEGFLQNLVKEQAGAEQGSLGLRAFGRFDARFSFGRNSVYIGFDRFFRAEKSNIQVICFCVCHNKPPG